MITETGRIFYISSVSLYLSLVIAFCSFSVFCAVGWGEVSWGREEISLTRCLKAVTFQCWLDSFLVIMVLRMGSTSKKINYSWWFFTECFSSLLLLSCASKHAPLSVKTENCEPLVAVLQLFREIIELKITWFPEMKGSFICSFKEESSAVSWFV